MPTASLKQSTLHASRLLPRHARLFATTASAESDLGSDVQWVEVGVVGPPHGVRGEFKVQPLTDFPEERLGQPGPRWLAAPTPRIAPIQPTPPQPVELEWGRPSLLKGREVWLVKLDGIDSPEEAALIRGHRLLIPPSARPPLEDEDEFYVQDLVGLKVFLEGSGDFLGLVVDVMDGTGTHDVLRIRLHDVSGADAFVDGDDDTTKETATSSVEGAASARFVMLPFAKALVPHVDLEAKAMRVAPPDGLLDLAAPATETRTRKESAGRRERRKPRPSSRSKVDTDSSGAEPEKSERQRASE